MLSNGGALLFVLFVALCFRLSDTATPSLVVPPDSQCACIGMELTYKCTAVGRGSTLWTGTAFDCTNNWINLRHSLFNDTGRGATGDCSGGAIVGESVGVTDDCYTSRLRVRIAADMNNKTIRCDHRPGTEINTIGLSTLAVITGPLPWPSDVHPVGLLQGNLTFQWTSVAPACSSNLEHRINSMSCGTCVLSSTTTATCYNVPQPMTTCSFSVQSTVCGDQVGEFSIPVEVTLKVPGVPNADIMPVYTVDGKISTAKIVIANNQTIYPYVGFSVPVSSYNISFSNSTSSVMLGSIDASPCEGVVCEYLPDISTHCPSTGSISIAVSAANELGVGLPSDPISIECANGLVKVAYDTESSTISCIFDDPRNTTGKLCRIEYGNCNSQQMEQITIKGSSTLESPNIVMLQLQFVDPNQLYCYNVTSSNGSYTVIVMGNIGMDGGKSNLATVAVIAVVIVLVVAVLVVASILAGLRIYVIRRKHKNEEFDFGDGHRKCTEESQPPAESDDLRQKLQLQPVEKGRFQYFSVDSDYQLQEFLAIKGLTFRRGCAFYEFLHEVEYVSEDKELIFMKGVEEFFSPTVGSEALQELGYVGEKIWRSKVNAGEYRIFVQSTSASGTRHLPANSMILYDNEPNLQEANKTHGSRRHLLSSHFKCTQVNSKSDCSLKDFCDTHNINAKRFVIFLELGATERKGDIRDVILQRKVPELSPLELVTGPYVRRMVSESMDGLDELRKEWRIFYAEHSRFKEGLSLKAGSFVLHQESSLEEEEFHVLEVDESYVQMSSFVKKKLKLHSFENGRAFYEFTGKEDLNYYKEVVNVPKKKLQVTNSMLSLQPDVSLFYSLPGTPGLSIKPPDSADIRWFVQSTSHGSRCLKAGDTVLYKNCCVADNEESTQM